MTNESARILIGIILSGGGLIFTKFSPYIGGIMTGAGIMIFIYALYKC